MSTTGVKPTNDEPNDDREALRSAVASAEQRAERAEAAAQAAKEELQGFVYAASHDVKEALRSVSSYAQLLVRQAPSDGELGEFSRFITEGVRSAVAILDHLNLFSRIDPSPRKTHVKLGAVAQMAVLNQQSAIKDAGAQVEVGEMPEATVNESQWALLFDNLIDNALKYCGEGTPHIEITAEETDDGVEVSVLDNGPGILPEYHEAVFRPFKRLHGKEIRGIGLGLSLCQKIANAHHGRIWVESDGHHGSVFKVLLPY